MAVAAVAVLDEVADPVALILLPLASLLALGLGIALDNVTVKKNRLKGALAFYLLMGFNVLVITSIIVAVLALFSLFGLIAPELSPRTLSFIWSLPALLIAFQTAVIVERRINSPLPRPSPAIAAIIGLVTLFDVLLWINALLVQQTNFLFLTDIQLVETQAVYLLLTGATLQAVTAMIVFRIPTMFELIFFRSRGTGRLVALTSASPIIFTLAFTGIVLIGSLVFVLFADRVFNLGGILPESFGLRLLLVFPVALITFFLVAGFLSYQRSKVRYHHKMDAERKATIALTLGSSLATVVLLLTAWRLGTGEPVAVAGTVIPGRYWVEALVAGILAATGPLGFFLQAQQHRIRLMEMRLSDFLRDLAETSKAGLPLHQSLQGAVEKDYGPLTPEIQRMSTQCSWGLSFAEAFRRFGSRTSSRLVRRAANLVVETSVSGGNTGDVLSATGLDIHHQKSLEEDRRLAMSTYIAVIYIVFFVFIAVLGVLAVLFLPQLLATTQAATQAGATSAIFGASRASLGAIKDAYFQALLVQAFGNGMIAGMIRDGSIGAGMKHVFILTIVAYGAYRLLFL